MVATNYESGRNAALAASVDTDNIYTPKVIAVDPTTGGATGAKAAIYTGQKKVAVTGTAVALATTQALVNGVTVKANNANAAKITVGLTGVTNTVDGTGNGFPLAAGESVSFPITDVSLVFINGTANDWASYLGN